MTWKSQLQILAYGKRFSIVGDIGKTESGTGKHLELRHYLMNTNDSNGTEMKFVRKGTEFIARKAYPNGLKGFCPNSKCPLFLSGREAGTAEYVEWIVNQSWPRCKKCNARIEVEPIR